MAMYSNVNIIGDPLTLTMDTQTNDSAVLTNNPFGINIKLFVIIRKSLILNRTLSKTMSSSDQKLITNC